MQDQLFSSNVFPKGRRISPRYEVLSSSLRLAQAFEGFVLPANSLELYPHHIWEAPVELAESYTFCKIYKIPYKTCYPQPLNISCTMWHRRGYI